MPTVHKRTGNLFMAHKRQRNRQTFNDDRRTLPARTGSSSSGTYTGRIPQSLRTKPKGKAQNCFGRFVSRIPWFNKGKFLVKLHLSRGRNHVVHGAIVVHGTTEKTLSLGVCTNLVLAIIPTVQPEKFRLRHSCSGRYNSIQERRTMLSHGDT